MNLPKRIADARKRLGLSQAELAKKLGVSTGTVAGWESKGERHHGIAKNRMAEVAKILKLDVLELLA